MTLPNKFLIGHTVIPMCLFEHFMTKTIMEKRLA